MNKQNNQNKKRKIEGIVVSDKMNKTVVVDVWRFKKHPLYHKILKDSKHFKAHDENNEAKIGDKVIIEETRPLSKDKRWKVIKIVKKNQGEKIDEEIKSEEEMLTDEKIESDVIIENQ